MRAWLAVLALCWPAAAAAQTWLVVVGGLGGEPRYSAAFSGREDRLVQAARGRLGIDPARIVHLGERTRPPATRASVMAALADVARRADSAATVVIVLIGHGSAQGADARFNVAGPDLTAADVAGALAACRAQRIVVVNTASASGAWIAPLSGPGRIVITATRSGNERDQAVFGDHFVAALAGDGADADKNGRVSLLEAFEFARRETARHYEEAGRLRTEHALLDDDGDRQGTLEPGPTGDGRLAAVVHLDAPAGRETDPAIAALLLRQDSLERAVGALRQRRAATDSIAYQRELERLLLETARVGREIRQRRGEP